MKQSYRIALITAFIVSLWIISAILFPGEKTDSYTENKQKEIPLTKVRVEQRQAVEKPISLTILGLTKAIRKIDIRAETSGLVQEIYAIKGSFLRADDELVRLDLKNRPANLKKAKANLSKALTDLKAAEKLAKSGVRAQTNLAQAQAIYEDAVAAVSAIQLDIANTIITSPIHGLFHKKHVNIGDFIDIGDPVATMLDLKTILVTGSVTEANIRDIQIGTVGKAKLLGGKTYTGVVTYKSAIADPKTRTFEIELRIDNEAREIAEGMTAELTVPIRKERAHFISPAALTLSDDGKIGVKLINDKHQVAFHPVTILDHSKEGIWLTGLPENIQLIIVGQEFVSHGQTVQPVFVETEKN